MINKNYIYYDFTISLCSKCLKRIDAKIVFRNQKVWMLKRCPEHGPEEVMIASDIDYYKRIRNYNKQSEYPKNFNSSTNYGCPYDCGLCKDHEQHSCLTLIEVTDRCNLTCPTCYAESSPSHGRHRTLEEINAMFDLIVENEGEPDVIQLSGGEPTIHPQFFEILDLAKSKPFKHLMINTNGIRIAKDEKFTERLASYMPNFEVYLQFDSFEPEVLKKLRGEDLTEVRIKALEHLNKFNLSTTLVVTLQKDVNTQEIGKIIQFALKQKCVRGVTFQPVQSAGRLEKNSEEEAYTLTEVRQNIIDQSGIFTDQDLIPVPCNPDSLMMGYALKIDENVFPLTRFINPEDLLDNSKNTIVFERDEKLKDYALRLFSTGTPSDKAYSSLQSLLCCLPSIEAPSLSYNNLFRVIVIEFMDAYNFDVRSVKKSCVHIVSKDGKIIPFETMNLFYRSPEKVKTHQNLTYEG